MNGWVRSIFAAIAAFILATQLGNGCTSSNSGSDDDYDRPSRPDYGDRDLPRRAQVVAEGRGDTLTYRATENGRVRLTDTDRGRMIDSRGLQRGEEYVVSTRVGKVWIDRDRKLDHTFDRGNVHRVYFQASSE